MRLKRRHFALALILPLGVVSAACNKRPIDDSMTSITDGETLTTGGYSTAANGDTTSVVDDLGGAEAVGSDPTTGPPGDSEVYDKCREYYAAVVVSEEARCVCDVLSGTFSDLASCVAVRAPSADEVECICGVYAKDSAVKAALDCIRPPLVLHTQCFIQAGCGDDEAQHACAIAYVVGVSECPAISKDVEFEVRVKCDGETPFSCGSGEQIPESGKCDAIPDCRDETDELDCLPVHRR